PLSDLHDVVADTASVAARVENTAQHLLSGDVAVRVLGEVDEHGPGARSQPRVVARQLDVAIGAHHQRHGGSVDRLHERPKRAALAQSRWQARSPVRSNCRHHLALALQISAKGAREAPSASPLSKPCADPDVAAGLRIFVDRGPSRARVSQIAGTPTPRVSQDTVTERPRPPSPPRPAPDLRDLRSGPGPMFRRGESTKPPPRRAAPACVPRRSAAAPASPYREGARRTPSSAGRSPSRGPRTP